MKAPRPREDLVGQRFGSLVVVAPMRHVRKSGLPLVVWKLRCDCGHETWAQAYRLRRGMSRCYVCRNRATAAKKATLIPGGRVLETARAIGITASALRQRIHRLEAGAPVAEAFFAANPPRHRERGELGRFMKRRVTPERTSAVPLCPYCGRPPVRPVYEYGMRDRQGNLIFLPAPAFGVYEDLSRPACFECWSRDDALREAEEHGAWFGAPEPAGWEDEIFAPASPHPVHRLSTGLSTEVSEQEPEPRRAVAS